MEGRVAPVSDASEVVVDIELRDLFRSTNVMILLAVHLYKLDFEQGLNIALRLSRSVCSQSYYYQTLT